MKHRLYQVDAFADQQFTGNPAAVCLLNQWLPDPLMQSISAENNLAETAFLVPRDSDFEIRWFTPTVEVELCGHATLASAHVLMDNGGSSGSEVTFHSQHHGPLAVQKREDLYILDFPADNFSQIQPAPQQLASINHEPVECFRGATDCLMVFETRQQIETMKPDFALLKQDNSRGLIVTAPDSGEFDFVSRFFAPQSGIDEDPVTGSAHTTLIPYWSQRLGKSELLAKQISTRGGIVHGWHRDDRVLIGGQAITYLTGEISTDAAGFDRASIRQFD